MRALSVMRHDRFAGLTLKDNPEPTPTAGQVSIKVAYAGIGLIDALWTTGAMPSPVGFVPGLEVSGVVHQLGEGVRGFTPGQRVAAFLPGAGGFAEIACTSAHLVAAVPDDLAMDKASVVPVNTITAHLALTSVARFTPGERLLVHAAVGGLGSQFAQVAHSLGAGQIDGVVGSPAKQRRARQLGYEATFLRRDLDAIPKDTYDIVVDPVGGEATRSGFACLRAGGRLLRVGNASQAAEVPLGSIAHWLENKSTVGFNVGGWLATHPEQGTASLQWALAAVANGEVQVELSQVGSLDQAADLLATLERGDTTGKLALRISDEG